MPADEVLEEENGWDRYLRCFTADTLERLSKGPLGSDRLYPHPDILERFRKQVERGVIGPDEVAPLVWCRIHLGLVQMSDLETYLHVTFQNLYTDMIRGRFLTTPWPGWEFRVYDENGTDIMPPLDGWINPRRGNPIVVDWHDLHTDTFRITCEEDGRWRFGRCYMEPGKTYRIQFDYCFLLSNEVMWTVPG